MKIKNKNGQPYEYFNIVIAEYTNKINIFLLKLLTRWFWTFTTCQNIERIPFYNKFNTFSIFLNFLSLPNLNRKIGLISSLRWVHGSDGKYNNTWTTKWNQIIHTTTSHNPAAEWCSLNDGSNTPIFSSFFNRSKYASPSRNYEYILSTQM